MYRTTPLFIAIGLSACPSANVRESHDAVSSSDIAASHRSTSGSLGKKQSQTQKETAPVSRADTERTKEAQAHLTYAQVARQYYRLAAKGHTKLRIACFEDNACALLETDQRSVNQPQFWLTPSILKTKSPLNVRALPSTEGDLLRSLPPGTIVVAFHGEVSGHPSGTGKRGSWTFVSPNGVLAGWSSSRFLVADEGCLPNPEVFLSDVPEAHRPAVLDDATISRQTVSAKGFGYRPRSAFVFLGIDNNHPISWMGLYDAGESCELTNKALWNVKGVVEEIYQTWGGTFINDPLERRALVVSWRRTKDYTPMSTSIWNVFTEGADDPIWEDNLHTHPSSPARLRSKIVVPGKFGAADCAFSLYSPPAVGADGGWHCLDVARAGVTPQKMNTFLLREIY